MDHTFIYDPSSGVKDPSVRGSHAADLPDTCRECGSNCSPTERRICLSEIDGVF